MSAPAVTFDAEAADAFLRRLWALDERLVKAGFHETSPWWREQLERLVRALPRRIRRAIIRAGRRAGKSSTICRLLVAWALWGAWHVPTGDVAVIAFLSVSRDEAGARLRTIAAILDMLGFGEEQRLERDGEIEIETARGPVVFRVYAATTRAVGFTAIAIVGDEVARWESRDTAANPAAEVFGSLFPTLASQPFGFALLVSSPWGSDDYHAQRFDEGDSDAQIVAFAPTWTANPTISEERTRELEPDPRIWQREYAAEPGATVTAAIDRADVAACFGRALPADVDSVNSAHWSPFAAIDASSLRGDDFAYLLGLLTSSNEIVVTYVAGFGGEELRHLSMLDVVRTISTAARKRGAPVVFGDQREEASLHALFKQQNIEFRSFAWTPESKDTAMQTLRRLMRSRSIYLPEHAQLRSQLTSMKARLMPSGRVKYETNGLDYASALLTLIHALDAGVIGSRFAFDFENFGPVSAGYHSEDFDDLDD